MDKTSKQPPVDREKLLIALECCRDAECSHCLYRQCSNAGNRLILDGLTCSTKLLLLIRTDKYCIYAGEPFLLPICTQHQA